MLVGGWKVADFDELTARLAARCRSAEDRAVEKAPSLPAGSASGHRAAYALRATPKLMVEVDAPSGGILVLNDVWHPWWRATIDGVGRRDLRANVIFRAVAVPPGKHTVRFTFEPLRGAWRELTREAGRPPAPEIPEHHIRRAGVVA